MAESSYERQHLALHAAGSINATGTTVVTFGCQMTRIGTGHYGLLLDPSNGLVDDESYTFAQVKGTTPRGPVVDDTSNTLKTIRVFSPSGAIADTPIEVAVYKTVTR